MPRMRAAKKVWRLARPWCSLGAAVHMFDPSPPPVSPGSLWLLDPAVTFLNHGSFGACLRVVLECQRRWQERLERQPVRFLVRELEGFLDDSRATLARFVGAHPDHLVLVSNATMGVNTVLRSLTAQAGDEWLVTDHAYNACRNALDAAAARAGARVVVADVPFPIAGEDDCLESVLAAVTPRTTLALMDHVSSQTGLVWPIARLVRELAARGVDTLVDGAHAPGMVPLELERLGAAYYTGNCHKWMGAPKGAAFLHVRPDRQDRIRPLVISHGANSRRQDRSRFQLEFGWTGTWDPSAFLTVQEALGAMAALHPEGWPGLMRRNHELAVAARRRLVEALGIAPPCPESMLGALASVPLPDGDPARPPRPPLFLDPLQDELWERHGIEVPVIPWPAWPRRLLRISAQAYNTLPQYERLARLLPRPGA